MSLRLRDGDRVGIVGGGPAGSFAAMHLLKLAEQRGLRLEVLIFEPRLAQVLGPRGCKGCAGILSHGAVQNMATLGLSVPPDVVQSELRAYVVHVAGHGASIAQPDPRRRILSIYRGGGPRLHEGPPLGGFDSFLLGEACSRGARHVAARVRRVEWQDGPVICTDDNRFPCQFLVLATGVNSRPPLAPGFGYEPPATASMAQDEIWRPDNWPEDKVVGFFDQPPGLVFGALVPKGRYLSVSLLWRSPEPDAIRQFYAAQREALQRFYVDLPDQLCGCNPRIVTRPAPVYYGDRWVAVGDAVVSKLYKDGINSAFITAGRAMKAAVEHGIERSSFAEVYEPLCRHIAHDNRYGELLYTVASRVLRSPLMAGATMGSVRAEAGVASERRFQSSVLWGMLTGDESYRSLFLKCLHPRGLLGITRQLLREIGAVPARRGVTNVLP
jgi:flavin-dependent dehydrogenase